MLEKGQKVGLDFYKISFKPTFTGQIKYGQGYYDFEEGGLAFLKPKQIIFSPEDTESYEGIALCFHPDFIRNYPLGKTINQYGFFSYDVSEALFLSAKEKEIIANLFATIANELDNNIDSFRQDVMVSNSFATIANELDNNIDSFRQDVMVSQIELLLNYSNNNSICDTITSCLKLSILLSNSLAIVANKLDNNIDSFRQDVMVSQIELLLNYSNRFYNRQFITRKAINHDIITSLDKLLNSYFEEENSLKNGLPSVKYNAHSHLSCDF